MIETLAERFGDSTLLFAFGLIVGLIFGAAAQHSQFCLRAATIEFAEARPGPRFAVWLLAFGAAVLLVQAASLAGFLETADARQIAATGSMSGAIIGGGLFGIGMILARGCASRLLVLSATGNLRALITGLVLTIVAQASLRGGLSPLREALSSLWTVPGGGARDLLAWLGAGHLSGALFGGAILLLGGLLVRRHGLGGSRVIAACLVGGAVALGWVLTWMMTQVSFEPLQAGSVSFTGPSADTLMGLVNERSLPMTFSVGLVPGVFAGSMLAALLTGSWRLQGFEGGPSMLRYLAGAVLMGFGAMLAGGCAVGAGVTGGAIFALTAWIALAAMWAGAVATVLVLRRVPAGPVAIIS